MFEFLENYNGIIEVNGKELSAKDAVSFIENNYGNFDINLIPNKQEFNTIKDEIKVTVKPVMTRLDGGVDYDFNTTFNNGVQMPLRTMYGRITKETKSMYYMELHGKVTVTARCICCGRTITNKISTFYGVGRECAKKLQIPIIENNYELEKYKNIIEDKLSNISWSGWIKKEDIQSLVWLDEEK